MNQNILKIAASHFPVDTDGNISTDKTIIQEYTNAIIQNMHRKVIASILITDVIMEEKGLTPTSEDYIRAINKDFEITT